MRRAEEMTLPQIAAALDLPLQDVQVAYAMGLRKLRRIKKPVQTLRSLAHQLQVERERRTEVA